MSSKISSIYDHLVTLIGATLPTYSRIPNPYFVDENNQLYLRKGYGIAIGPGSGEELETCSMAWNRIFTLVLIQQVTTTDHNTDSRVVIEKDIVEDHFSLINAIESDTYFGGYTTKVEVVGDSGLQFLTNDRFRYLSISIDVNVLYQENYNA